MTTRTIDNLQTPIGKLMKSAGRSGLLLEKGGKLKFALLPIDDDTLDFLLEHSPKLIAECEARRKSAAHGNVVSLEEAKKLFPTQRRGKRTVKRARK
jgi:hypothetical protein